MDAVLVMDDSRTRPLSVLAPETSLNLDTLNSNQVRNHTKGLVRNLARNYWYLAESFGVILERRLYLDWGYVTFEQYAENECDMKRNKAYGLAKIYNYFTNEIAPQFEDQPALFAQVLQAAKEMGWVKALRLATARVLTSNNAPVVLEQATTLSSEQLDMAIRTSLQAMAKEGRNGAGSSPRPPKLADKSVRRPFAFTLDQAEHVEESIRKAALVLPPGADENVAIAHICERYFNEASSSIEEILVDIENRFGVCLVAFNHDYSSVVYGEGTLDEFNETRAG